MRNFDLNRLVRPSVLKVKPYSTARDDFRGPARLFLDANENPYPSAHNRYPDPHQAELKARLATLKGVAAGQVFLGNGSDEVIDLLLRAFCEPAHDNVIVLQPTYGMYAVSASVNQVAVRFVSLQEHFDIDPEAVLQAADANTKLAFLCSPNNPTGNLLSKGKILQLLQGFPGLVVVDEAYIDFANDPGLVPWLPQYPNLFLLQTLSKAWGLAGIRLGLGIGADGIVSILNRIKPPYNINVLTQQAALEALRHEPQKKQWVAKIVAERKRLAESFQRLDSVKQVFPSDANFLLVRFSDAKRVYRHLLDRGIVVRDRSEVALCSNCLRITIGTPGENDLLIDALKDFENNPLS